MIKLSKISMLALSLSFLFTAPAFSGVDGTKLQLLVVVNPMINPDFFFTQNGVAANPGILRTVGSNFGINAFILKQNTVDPRQSSYLVDKKGHAIIGSSRVIGMAYFNEFMLQQVDYSLPLVQDQVIEQASWILAFDKDCGGAENGIMAQGFGKTLTWSGAQAPAGTPTVEYMMNVTSGFGCNQGRANAFVAKVYSNSSGESIIDLNFDQEIQFKTGN